LRSIYSQKDSHWLQATFVGVSSDARSLAEHFNIYLSHVGLHFHSISLTHPCSWARSMKAVPQLRTFSHHAKWRETFQRSKTLHTPACGLLHASNSPFSTRIPTLLQSSHSARNSDFSAALCDVSINHHQFN